LFLLSNSEFEIMDVVPNHTFIRDCQEEYARLEESIKSIEELIQEIND